ncbi:MAG: hypothetical protein IPF90_06710 [Actinomycetales bacterium]|nr:hypothetical protein [Candidatus Phosphoribacter baldrii]
MSETAGRHGDAAGRPDDPAHPRMVRRLVVAPDGVPPAGRVLVRTGRVLLVEVADSELVALAAADPEAAATLWAPEESEPDGIPLLTAAEREAVSAAVLVTPSDTARRLEGADWDDPAAEPPDRPR